MSRRKTFDVQGKTILITGGGSGIGAASARLLHSKGANIILVDVNGPGMEALIEELGAPRSMAIMASVTDRNQLDKAVEKGVAHFGGIDVVFANAGIACDPPTTMRCMDEAVFERIIEVDLLGVTRTVQACLPQIIARKGHVLMTASTSAFINGIANVPYGIAKAGVEMFGRSLRAELAHTGATAGVLLPCWTKTPIAENALGGHKITTEIVRRGFPFFLRKPISPETVAEGVVSGIETRAASIFRPRRWAVVSLLRGMFNPVTDRLIARDRKMQALIIQLESESPK